MNNKSFYARLIRTLAVITAGIVTAVVIISVTSDALGLSSENEQITFTVEKGATAKEVAKTLKENGVIEHPHVFLLFSKVTKSAEKFKYGTYTLGTDMDYLQLATALKKAGENAAEVSVTITEGMTQREIFALLEERGVCDVKALEQYSKSIDFKYANAHGERVYTLEGYLFPDTYRFYQNDSAKNVVDRLLSRFESAFTDDMKKRADELEFTVDEVVILASIVEKEATENDRERVASVFHNRLKNWQRPLLQSCATVLYALGEKKEVLSYEDIEIESAYNTYKYAGLPVGPIANPGLAAINAVLYPEQSEYYYFVADKNGAHVFSKTYEEHKTAVAAINTK